MIETKRAEIRTLNGRPCMYYDGQPLAYGSYWVRSIRSDDAAERIEQQMALMGHFTEHDIHQYELAYFRNGWSGPGQFDPDFSDMGHAQRVDHWLAEMVKTDPDALAIIGVLFTPPNWWKELHPEECETNENGDRFGASLGSELFRKEVADACRRLVEFVESTPYRDHVLAYHIWWTGTEGFTDGCLHNSACDFSPAMERTFRKWVQEQYQEVNALRQAWNDPEITFETVAVPSSEDRRAHDELNLLDPTQRRRVIDFYTCQGDCLYQTWTELLQAGKNACGGRALIGTYGGYVQVAGWSPNYWGNDGPAGAYAKRKPFKGMPDEELHTHLSSGQFTWSRILDHPAVDFLASPYDYYYRKWGASLINQGLGESANLRGKLFIINEDTRTHLHGSTQYSGADSPEETRALYRRNFAAIHTTCNGCNWMEQVTPWLIDPMVLDELQQFNQLLQRGVHWPDTPAPEDMLCAIIDEESLKYQAPFTDIDFENIYKMRVYGLSHCGVPLRVHAFSDIARDNFPRYKAYVFLNNWYTSPERLALLREKVLRDGNVAVWQYAPGYITDQGFSTEAMQELTGMQFRVEPIRWEHLTHVFNWQHALTRDLPSDCWYGTERRYGPAFIVDDPAATPLGWLMLSQGRHEIGLAVKEMGRGARGNGGGEHGAGDFASVFTESPLMPAELIRAVARYAGCHVYSEQNDVLYAGRGILAVHAAKPGPRHLRLPAASRVWDLYSGELVAEKATEFNAEFPEPMTRVFYLGDDPGR
ncbi:MAG: beta-galactosidase [Armatimonadota bacterium]